MSRLSPLRVTQWREFEATEATLVIDEYVPLRFRTYRPPLGVGYVRVGNYTTTLVEIPTEPRSQVVRGLTVTSIGSIAAWPSFNVVDISEGLPCISTTFAGGEVVSLQQDFAIATRDGEILVFWERLGNCKGYRVGSTTFLVADEILAGAHFANLTESQVNLFKSHAGR